MTVYLSAEKKRNLETPLKIGSVELVSRPSAPELESEEIGVVEATIAPRSALDGQTLSDVDFRNRRGLQVLAVWREGHPIRGASCRSYL